MKKLNIVIAITILLYSIIFPLFYFIPSLNSSPLALYYLLFPIVLILAVIWGIIFFANVLRSFFTKTPMSLANRLSIYIYLAALLIYPIVYSFSKPLPTGSFERKFDKYLWNDSIPFHGDHIYTKRQKMVGDLISYVLPKKNKTTIINILGEPLKNNIYNGSDMIIYELGPERDGFLNLDTEILEVYFDKNNVFKKAIIQVY